MSRRSALPRGIGRGLGRLVTTSKAPPIGGAPPTTAGAKAPPPATGQTGPRGR